MCKRLLVLFTSTQRTGRCRKMEGIVMEEIMELLMILAFCVAIAVQLVHQISGKKAANPVTCAALAALCAGFLIGTVNKIITAPSSQMFLAYLSGFMLSYSALVLTFPGRKAV